MYKKLDCFFNVPENARLMESNWHVMYNVGCWRKYNINNGDFSCFRSKLEVRGIVFSQENSSSDGWFRIRPFDKFSKGIWADFYMKNISGEIDEMYLVFYDSIKNEMFITYTTDNPIDAPIYESR